MRLVPFAFALISCADDTFVGLPYLESEPVVALGPVPVGVPVDARVDVFNVGTADARATVQVPPGLDGPSVLQIPAGGSVALAVRFELVDGSEARFPVTVIAGDSSVTVSFEARGITDADADGFVSDALGGDDCDDGDPDVHPGATETCDGDDQDCDGVADDLDALLLWYADDDGDGFGDPNQGLLAGCAGLPDTVADRTDCNDSAPTVHPGALELDDSVDQDCDGAPDEDHVEPGDALIVEVHLQPTDPDAAYVELRAVGSRGLEPGLLTVNGGSITGASTIPPGGLGLICAPSAPSPLVCAGFGDLAGVGPWSVAGPSGPLDTVDLAEIGGTPGVSRELDPAISDPADNDGPAGWCDANEPAGTGDLGTPGSFPTSWCD